MEPLSVDSIESFLKNNKLSIDDIGRLKFIVDTKYADIEFNIEKIKQDISDTNLSQFNMKKLYLLKLCNIYFKELMFLRFHKVTTTENTKQLYITNNYIEKNDSFGITEYERIMYNNLRNNYISCREINCHRSCCAGPKSKNDYIISIYSVKKFFKETTVICISSLGEPYNSMGSSRGLTYCSNVLVYKGDRFDKKKRLKTEKLKDKLIHYDKWIDTTIPGNGGIKI